MKNILFLILGLVSVCAGQQRRSLGPPINTPEFTEYAPSVSSNEKTLIYETDRGENGRWELYTATKNDKGRWNKPKPLTKINAQGRADDLIGGPSVSYDGNTLFFFATFEDSKGREDLYFSVREGEDWSAPKNLGGSINTPGYEGFPSVSPDGKRLYFVRESPNTVGKKQNLEVCYAIWAVDKKEDGSWGEPVKLPPPINLGCEKSPRISADGRTLFFSSIRDGGLGSFDLYQSFQEDDGVWTAPDNLGYINTEASDQFASVNGRGDLMYYQNSGDIFTVTIPDKYRKYKLVNFEGKLIDAATKAPVSGKVVLKSNNPKEKSITLTTDGAFSTMLRVSSKYTLTTGGGAYYPFSAGIDFAGIPENETVARVFTLTPTTLTYQFEAYDKETKAPVKDLKVKILEVDTKKIVEAKTEGGVSTVTLTVGTAYKFASSATGYKFFVRPLKPDSSEASKNRTKRVPLEKLKKDEPVVLDNITFETGSAELKPESFEELDRVVKMLEDTPAMKIELSAHTDDQGSDDSNLKLSERRAKSVVAYFTQKGIKPERLVSKGYGETQPIVANDTDENRAKNRRVQFKILQ